MSLRQRLFTGLVRVGAVSAMASRAFLFRGIGVLNRSAFDDLSRRSWRAFAHTDDEARSGFTAWEDTIFTRFVKADERPCIVAVEPSPAPAAMPRRILRETHSSTTVIEARGEPGAILCEHSYVPRRGYGA
jgi:hypothetical protein